jgi:hypothetical protein
MLQRIMGLLGKDIDTNSNGRLMANLVTLRDSLASDLSAAGRVVYAFPREQITPPAIVLVPASPYITPVAIGGLSNRLNVRFA